MRTRRNQRHEVRRFTPQRFETAPLAEVLQRVTDVEAAMAEPMGTGEAGERRSPAGAPGGGLRRRPASGKPRILVVDDERTIADTLAMILETRGYEVTVAYDAETALQKYDQVRPSLVLSDVVMPGMNGVDMAMVMRERAGCPILLLSGQAETCDLLARARAAGHEFELLNKPIHPTDLIERIALCVRVTVSH